ncbi:myosin-17-like protein [Tanacetum coccineum]
MRVEGIVKRGGTRQIFEPFVSSVVVIGVAVVVIVVVIVVVVVVESLVELRTDHLRKVEAKYPALLFHEQLTDLLMKIYGMSRDNLKKELSPLLELCILAPRASLEAVAPWQRIVKEIDNHLETMKANFVTPFLVPKAFTQIFLFINVQLFNRFRNLFVYHNHLCKVLLYLVFLK